MIQAWLGWDIVLLILFSTLKWPQTSFQMPPKVDLVNQGVNLTWQLEHYELCCLLGQPMIQYADGETTYVGNY